MDTKQLIGEAQLLFVHGRIEESIAAFARALEAGADPFMVHLSVGVGYLKLREADKAIDSFSKAAGVKSDHPRAYYYRGLAFLGKKDYEKAVSDLSRALELKPDLHASRFARAAAFVRLQNLDEAIKDLRIVLPEMEANMQQFTDTYGILRTEMSNVMDQTGGGREMPALGLAQKEMDIINRWLQEE
jgi:tetratricopeptide (TPR) repeat protein